MTEAEILAWLRRDDRKRVVLVEIDYIYQSGTGEDAAPTLGTLYFSNIPYVDETGSPLIRYQADLIEAPEYERALDRATLRGKYNVNVGSTVINNADGEYDYFLTLALDGSEQRVYVGDETWDRLDFIHLFTALSVKARAPRKKVIQIDLRDPALLLNKSIGGTTTVGGTGPSANKFKPVVFGFVHQMQPILYDVNTSTYVFADTGTDTSVVEVRNDGVSVSFTDNADGTFSLAVPPTGNETITCDVRHSYPGGSPVGSPTVATNYRVSDAFNFFIGERAGLTALGRYSGAGDIYELDGVNDYHIGRPVYEMENCIQIANDLCNTSNGFWAFTRLGSFFYSWMRPEALSFFIGGGSGVSVSIAAEIGKDDIRGDSFAIDHNAPTYSGYQAYGNVNWTDQTVFSSSLDAEEREQFTRKGYITAAFYGENFGTTAYTGATSWQGGAPELYHLSLSDSQLVETLIAGPDDTSQIVDSLSVDEYLQDWSSVRRSQNLPWMEFIDITVGLDMYALELGDIVNLTFPRHDLDAGGLLQVCKIRIKPMQATVDIGLVHRRFADVSGTPIINDLLAKETGELVLKEDGGGIIVATSGSSTPASHLLQLNDDKLLQLNGDLIEIT